MGCERFYEWNARSQLTTWNPTGKGQKIPGGPIDYASKHWSGLIKDYYGKRAWLIMQRAFIDATASRPLNKAAVERIKAEHAYNWTTSTAKYPTAVKHNALHISQTMLQKYSPWFASCSVQ